MQLTVISWFQNKGYFGLK